ncbi:MAG: hypothetical protein QXR53_00565 [Candidatus Norongarragalinales archaeon]
MKQTKRAQLSVEFMLVMAASAAFLLALSPAYAQAQEKTREAITDQTQLSAFQRIAGTARQAETMGFGALLKEKIFFQAETILSFDETTKTMNMDYSHAGKTKTLREKLGFPVKFGQAEFAKGEFQAVFENKREIQINFEEKRGG